MISLFTMIRIKFKILARRPILLVFCLLTPILLSLLSGATLNRNSMAHIRAAYVDQAGNSHSRKLTGLLSMSRMGWFPVEEEEIDRSLALGQLDGVILIPPNYGDRTASSQLDDVFVCDFLPGRNTAASSLVRENYLIASLVLAMEAKLQKDLLTLDGAKGMSLEEMDRLLTRASAQAREEGAVLQILIREGDMAEALPLVQVPNVAIDVLFLSVFSMVASLMLADAATQRRLRSLPGGYLRDYLANLLALALAGVLQLTFMATASGLLMPQASRPEHYPLVMGILLLFMLALGQILALIPADRRFVPASLILFVSVLAGGSLIRLPSVWMDKVGQYTPHGWALARMAGMRTSLSAPLVTLVALVLLILAYPAQAKSHHLSA